MKTYEFLKEIYEDAKSTYEYMRAENYRLSFEKFRNFLWVNLALFTAGLVFMKVNGKVPEVYIFFFTNICISTFILFKIAESRGFSNVKSPKDIGFDKRIDWVYDKVLDSKEPEITFYQGLILEKEEAIFQESKRVSKNRIFYNIIWIFIIIEASILFFAFYKYQFTGGG